MSITGERVEFDFDDAHGVEIRCYEWRAAEPVGVVQISHGIGEHALRYEAFARFLADIGFTVVAERPRPLPRPDADDVIRTFLARFTHERQG